MRYPIVLTILIGVFGVWQTAVAAMRVAPAVIDTEAFPRDDVYFTVHVINETGSTRRLTPLIGEFNAADGSVTISGTPYDANSLISANIEFPRDDFSVAPGASRSLTGKINVSPYIGVGSYHAIVAFTEEYTEPGKGIRLAPGTPSALLNVTVRKDIRERLNLTFFHSLRKVFLRFPAQLELTVNNGGNVAITPNAEVRFFDRRDIEQGTAKVVVPGGGIPKGGEIVLPVSWDGGSGFGRYRAQLAIAYGSANGGQVLTGSTTFWVLPWWFLLLLAGLLIILSYGAARMIVRAGRHTDA